MPAARPSSGPGLLRWFVPRCLADEVIAQARAEREAAAAAGAGPAPRLRLVPPWLALYFTLGLWLWAQLPYRDVARALGWGAVPASTALTAARRRLGERPLELLFWRVAGPLVTWREPWASCGGLLLAAWDATTIAAPASPENIAALGLPGTGAGGRGAAAGGAALHGHFPRARVVALVACGTRALLGAAAGPLADGEQKLALSLAGCLRPGILLLADRGYYSHAMWKACAATGADLLWRVKSSMLLPVTRPLPDGSWLTTVNDTPAARRRAERNRHRAQRGRGTPEHGPLPGDRTLRAIEFTVTATCADGTTRTTLIRAVTTLTDCRRYPASELAAAYARRWAIETAYRDLKATLAGGRTLRSRTPDLARQEIWALLVTYQAIRALACHAAATAGTSPDRISFATALHAARRTPGITAASAETAASPLPDRPPRTCARAITAHPSHFPLKRHAAQPLPQAVQYTTTITPPTKTTPKPRNQHNHPPHQPPTPP